MSIKVGKIYRVQRCLNLDWWEKVFSHDKEIGDIGQDIDDKFGCLFLSARKAHLAAEVLRKCTGKIYRVIEDLTTRFQDQQENKWISVEDQLPNATVEHASESVLATDGGYIAILVYRGPNETGDDLGWRDDENFDEFKVTHWMLLPEMP